jgi:predicted secreted protein
MKKSLILVLWLVSAHVFAGSIVKVSSVGLSPKGQFIAFEEFGFSDEKIPYSKIRVFNTWKNKYVSKEFKLRGKKSIDSLELIRFKVKKLASKDLKHFNISGS